MRETFHIWKEVMTEAELLHIEKEAETLLLLPGTQFAPTLDEIGGTTGEGLLTPEYRQCSTLFLRAEQIPEVYHKLDSLINEANKHVFGFNLYGIEDGSFQFTEYLSDNGGGFYHWHQDTHFTSERSFPDRKLTGVIQLSDPSEYEGGELQFKTVNSEIPIEEYNKRGTLIVFPSFFMHRVTPVTKGTRRSLVFWVDGPAFV